MDISRAVFDMAGHFPTNHDVLHDPRVRAVTMDGRAWLRRTDAQYDVITLEPMPPTFAGVNALYSREFYELAARRLRPGGIAAQWLPIHLVDEGQAAAVVAAFQAVFPDALLWVDPVSNTGVLLGRQAGAGAPLGADWPGFGRVSVTRSLEPAAVRSAVLLDADGLRRFAVGYPPVTDDNQRLAYNWNPRPGLTDFAEMNAAYGEFFTEPYPARSTVQAARLPRDARIEIDVIASDPAAAS